MHPIVSLSAKRLGKISISLIVCAIVFALSGSNRALALSTTTVTTTAITDNPADNQCDLWEALQSIADYNNNTNTDPDQNTSIANYHGCMTGAGPHVIVFSGPAVGGTITLPNALYNRPFSGLPFVTDNVTIVGPVVIDGGGPAINAHIFITNAGGKLTLMNMVVQNGYSSGSGGAILSLGGSDEINIIGSSIQNNNAEVNGGAINALGKVNILFSNFSGNKALGKDANGTDYPGQGGAIYVAGYNSLNVSLSNFAGNIASDGGGAIFTTADTGNISDSVFNGNIVNDDAVTDTTEGGAAIHNGGNNSDSGLTITRVAFNGNLSFNAHGGAIFNASDGYLHVYDSSFNGNIAGTLAFDQMGGAIYNQEVLDIRRVMFLGNVASGGDFSGTVYGDGGGVANDRTGVATFANVSFTANGAPDGDGAGIWNGNTQQGGPASYVYLYNVTFSINVSPNDGAAIYNQSDGSHEVYVANTIVDGIGILGDNCNEGLTSQGHNIDSANTCGFNQTADQVDTDPGLKTLDFNGGPLVSLLSHGLNSDSAAVDAGDDDFCANEYVENLDQRSDPRPKGNACDVGAFESDGQVAGYGSIPVPPGPIVIGNTSVGSPITGTFTILDIGNIPLEVSNPLITGNNPGQFEVVTPFPVTTSYQADIVLRCLATAEGNFTALLAFTTSAPEVPGVSYQLECNVNAAVTPGYGSDPIAPGTLDFGEVEVGNGDTNIQTLTLFEAGNTTLNVGNITLTGPNPSDFTLNTIDIIIPDGANPLDLPITCTPSDYGVRTATLTLTTTDPTQPTVNYALVCEGIAPPSPPLEPTGGLTTDSPEIPDGANGVAVSPDGLFVYVTSYINDKLTVYRRDTGTGNLTFVMDYTNTDMFGTAMVEVSPDGTQVYVTAQDAYTFLIFSRDAGSGIVSLDTVYKDVNFGGTVTGLQHPYGISVSPDGRFIYVMSWISNAVVTFYRDEDGFVGYDNTMVDNTNLYNAYQSVISPDGNFLYISGGINFGSTNEGYVTVYQRNILDGSLTFVENWYEGELIGCFIICFYINGLGGAWGITISPDGKSVYIAGYFDSAIVRFTRDPFDGTLTYNGYVANTLEQTEQSPEFEAVQVPGLLGVTDVRVSQDGKYLYATSYFDDALSVFDRNLSTGVLTQIQVLYNGGTITLDGARKIDLSPDGTSVYATAYNSDAVLSLHTANPIATLSGLLPASAQAGSGSLTVKVQGANFVPGSVVRVNGTDRTTTFQHPGELEVILLAGDFSSAGTLNIEVFTPAPGGGNSVNTLPFTVTSSGQNPIPSVDALLPGGAIAGDPALTLTIKGFNFVSGSTVKYNGANRGTTFVNSTTLQITVGTNDLLSPGPAVFTIFNPGPGGGTSNAVLFDIAAPGQNPVPTLTGIDPYFTLARGAAGQAITLQVFGQNFILGVQGQWNGQNRPTQFVSETEVLVTINAFDVAFGGSGAVTVVNPGPGGGPSNPAAFVIYPYAIYVPVIIRD